MMSVPATRSAPALSRLAAHAWWLLLLGALVLLWVATGRRIARVAAITDSPTWSVDAPPRDAASATGYARGQRALIVPGQHNPSYWWIMEAQQSVAEGRLRLRHIDYDAPPDGRDLRRTSLYRWWLIATGWLYGRWHGEPLGYAIERGALIADPLLLALLLVAGAAYSARFLGPAAALGVVVGGISLFPFAASFQPGAPDPHSLSWVLALGGLLPLLAASCERGGVTARTHGAIAGILGGLGFWNDAASQAPILLATGLGALGCEFFRTRGAGPAPRAPAIWRAWARAGALTTLVAGVFEFAPNHFAWSLDSVHPLHAVVWWGFGEVLQVAGSAWRERGRGFDRRSLASLAIAGVAIAAWPVGGLLSGTGALLATDFYALELAARPGRFAPSLAAWLHQPGAAGDKWATLLPLILVVVLLVRLIIGTNDREERGRQAFILLALVSAALLSFCQLRWWTLFDAFALAALAVLLAGDRVTWARGGALLVVLPGLIVGFPPAVTGPAGPELTPLEAQALIVRDFAYGLNRRAGPEPNILFAPPVFSSAAAYYGGFTVVTSSDAANRLGYLAAVRIASALTPQEVLILLRARGVTHVALPLWDPSLDQMIRIGLNLPRDQPLPPGAYAVALRSWNIPLWMRPMDYLIPAEPRFQGFELRAFALLETEQEPDVGLSRLADYFVDRGQLPEAQSLRDTLAQYPRSISALGAIANIDFALRDGPGLKHALESLIPALSRRWARDLPPDRRISLAALFLQTNHADLAREQVTACFAGLNAATLRTFTPGSAVNLVSLSWLLHIPFPDKNLEAVAMEMIPPSVRAGLRQP